MEYLGYKAENIVRKSLLARGSYTVIKNEKGKIVDSNFLGGEEDFKDFVLTNKYKLYCDILDNRFSDIFTVKNGSIYLEGDCIGKMSQKYFEFNVYISYSLREKLAQKLQKVFKDIRDYQEDYQSRRKIQEEDIKKELEERILKNLEKSDYIVVEPLADVFNKRLKEKGLFNKSK